MKNTPFLFLFSLFILFTSCSTENEDMSTDCYTCPTTATEYCYTVGNSYYTATDNEDNTLDINLNGIAWSVLKTGFQNSCNETSDCYTCETTETSYCFTTGNPFYSVTINNETGYNVLLNDTWENIKIRLGNECNIDNELCAKPINFTINSSTSTTVNLSWDSEETATSWEIEYGISGFSMGTGIIIPANTNPFTVTGLISENAYDFYIRSICNDIAISSWTDPITKNAVEVAPNHAMMTATINGTYFGNMKPAFYPTVLASKVVTTSFNDTKYLKIQGNDVPFNPTSSTREINLYIHESDWQVGTFNLISEADSNFIDSDFQIIYTNSSFTCDEVDGSITITEFNLETRVIQGTFEFTYYTYNSSTHITTGPFSTTGTFDYSLDHSEFD